MELSQLVTTYEQSQRIKELGFKKESMFCRNASMRKEVYRSDDPKDEYDYTSTDTVPIEGCEIIVGTNEESSFVKARCYTGEELGEILPQSLTNSFRFNRGSGVEEGRVFDCSLRIEHEAENKRRVCYYDEKGGYLENKGDYVITNGPTLAQAMGDMLIYLLESNLLKND